MFTFEEYLELRKERLDLKLELISLKSAIKLAYKFLDDKGKKELKYSLDSFTISEETKTHIYDSRTIEARKTEAEPNTETIS